MYALTMRFTLPEDTDWAKVPALMEERARTLYAEMPGLISKAFVYDPQTRAYGGNYVWESRELIEAFLDSDLITAAKAKFGEAEYTILPIAAYLERGKVHVPGAAVTA